MPRIFKTCRNCNTPDQTASWRSGACAVLCSTCNIDAERHAVELAQVPMPAPRPQPTHKTIWADSFPARFAGLR